MRWLAAAGGHFAGLQPAKVSLQHECSEAKQLRALLASSEWSMAQQRQVKEQAQRAKDAYRQLQAKMEAYQQRLEGVRATYIALQAGMQPALAQEVSRCAAALRACLAELRTQAPLVQADAHPTAVLPHVLQLQKQARDLSTQSSELGAARVLIQVSSFQAPSCTCAQIDCICDNERYRPC